MRTKRTLNREKSRNIEHEITIQMSFAQVQIDSTNPITTM